ncbi:DUF5131 family protein [Mycobacterium intracellulare]|uniref:DUF5131 family protein n=1 Tax=Mycobacterium intracellulare TaxID=1767 RepID=UPI00080B1E46|nr:phage Gp37/Gp68 family protein [Mycobacterium intracellulare]OCB15110.1 hypothetical protein A5689_27025 [Mycobacterium intracellulare subsp. yongonense]
MADNTGIEWTDATWNPVTGCDKVSAGCDHCYAETIAHRFDGTRQFPNGFRVTLRPERLGQPLRWRRPRRIFVNSMSDLFHDQVPDDYIAQVFAVMTVARQHTFQILTKRHARMRSLVGRGLLDLVDHEAASMGFKVDRWPLPNVWLGVSAENQQWADIRIPALLDTPAAVRFVSAEPLLGPIDLHTDPIEAGSPFWAGHLDWVIVGGESGPGARPMHPDWARSLRDQCVAADIPFLFKQWGEWASGNHRDPTLDGQVSIPYRPNCPDPYPLGWVRRIGKKAAGRELDGRTWDEYPAAVIHA